MDSNKVWQWRIMHAKKYSISPEPFRYSNEIGLNFNVASNSQKKMDLDLVTNGVILEVCDFAKTVIKGKGHFITQILENNFDLGLENEQHRVDFTAQILHKVKDLIRKSPEDKHKVFMLFDKPSNLECTNNSNNGLHMACRESKTESFPVEMDDTDDSEEEDRFNYSQATSKEYMTENVSDFESDESKQRCSGPQATTELKEVLPFSFSYCEEIGLSLDIGSKQSLDIGLFTKGVMLELVHFTRVLTASYNRIILDVLEHNFELDLKNEQAKNQVLFKVSQLLKRRKRLNTTGNKTEFKNEPFAFQTNPLKGPRGSSLSNEQEKSALLTTSEQGPEEHRQGQSKHMETNTLSHKTTVCTSRKTEGDHSDTYAQGESALGSDKQGHLKHPKYTEVPRESESSCLTTTDISSTLPIVNTIVNPSFERQPDKRGFCGAGEATQSPKKSPNKSDMEKEIMGTEHKKNILARIPAIMEQSDLSAVTKTCNNKKHTRNDMSTMEKTDCPNNLTLDSCSAGSSQAAVIVQNVGSSADTEHKNDLDLKLWKLRANHIQRILSMPHQEHCPLYPYSRCKKLGIDFNVGSGMKQNFDPKFLTNGIMLELNTFATELLSAQKHFITEILEHNFDLNFENELSRSAFADKVMTKIITKGLHKSCSYKRQHLMKKPFELPDVRCIEEPSYAKTLHCPKCYQDQKFHEDESDPGHMHHLRPHTMSDTVSADVKCTTQKHAKDVSSIFSTTEETIMDSYRQCKQIGLNLCVDKDLPKVKLDMHVLTNSVMKEVIKFAKKLCGTNNVVINDVLEHNFNIGKQSLDLNPAWLFFKIRKQNDGGPAWFNKVFVIQSFSHRPPGYIGKAKRESALHRSERMEIIRKRQLALQIKQERANMPRGSGENPYPVCTAIGLDLDVTSTSSEKVLLDLKLLTRAVVLEIHKFATLGVLNYYPRTVFDILDYNFDLSSQHYRRWEFSIATASKIQTMVKEYCRKDDNTEDTKEVFKLPFMFDPETSQQHVEKRQNTKGTNSSIDTAIESNSSCVDIHTHFLTSANMSSLPTLNSNVTSKIGNPPDERGDGDEEQTQTPRNAPNDCNMEQEKIRAENYYTCPLGESDLESDEVSDSENTGKQNYLRNPESFFPSSDIVSELESNCMGIHATLFTSINYQSDIEQEEMGTEHNMWKLRSNRVEQILSALTKDFGQFSGSKRVGLEYNVGFGPKQNISVDSLKDRLLLEIGKFALAINLSQKDFIMEILEYNFDLNLPSQHHRNIFASDIMTRVRQLRSCGDAVKFSNEVFKLPGVVASINMTAQSEGSVNPELGISKMGKCDVSPVCPPDSHAETKEHISCRSEDLYPLCKEIGLNLHVNNSQPNKKLEINKLTNGAMTEVTNFAEKLCGTFEQICLDILRHNLDFDLQRDSEFAKNILARLPVLIERRNLSVFSKSHKKMKRTMNDMSTMEKLDCSDNPNLDTCSAGSSQAAVIDQNVGSSADTDHQNDLDLKLWKLRANHIQRILSMPHREYCPFYSYSRCRELGIDFSVGSGVKQNLDPKLLTNGIMVELNTFATELFSAQKHFIMEVLEYNFDLNFENELYRSAFAKQIMTKIGAKKGQWKIDRLPFELPDTRCIQEPICGKILPCPKCYQDRNHEVLKDKSDPVHMHHPHPSTITGTDSNDVNCTVQQPTEDPSSTFYTAEETIMEGYPLCKEIGLNLCVDKDKPINKLDTHVLTYGILNELASFARELCGPRSKVLFDVLKHNFNIGMLLQNLNSAEIFSAMHKKVTDPDWFNKAFVLHRPRQLKRAPAIQKSNCLESIKKRKLALHLSQSQGRRVINSKPNYSICYPLCSEIGLDLDVTSESEEKGKLKLKLLTTAVVVEIHKYASQKIGHYYTRTVFDILDYNFDLSSQHHRRLEFSIATASKFQSIAKRYHKNKDRPDEVFKLPFVFEKEEKTKCKTYSQEKPVKKRSSCVRQVGHHSDVVDFNLLSGVQTKEEPCSHEDTKSSIDDWMMNVQNPGLVSVGCGSPLQENIQIKKEEYDPHYDKPEPDTEQKYHPQHVDVKAESNISDVEQFIPCEPAGSHGYAVITPHPHSESNINTESENECFNESHIQIELDIQGINSIIIDESYENVFI